MEVSSQFHAPENSAYSLLKDNRSTAEFKMSLRTCHKIKVALISNDTSSLFKTGNAYFYYTVCSAEVRPLLTRLSTFRSRSLIHICFHSILVVNKILDHCRALAAGIVPLLQCVLCSVTFMKMKGATVRVSRASTVEMQKTCLILCCNATFNLYGLCDIVT
jgi:hypothetical protein